MAQKFVSPETESELRNIQDQLYAASRASIEQGQMPSFKGLLEIISAEPTILTAIHNIKANKGSKTAGSDNERMQEDILERDFQSVVTRVKDALRRYKPKDVRRVYIPKPGKSEKRPLGIPAIIDRIIQECVRLALEPILEAQFFAHSYGFRPMRSAQQALGRVQFLVHHTGYHWIVEGDISKFFDTIDHGILLKKLYHMGIKDRRVLMIIKQMLKAGIMDEIKVNPLGSPQGGIISPLLANAYLHSFDEWCSKQWESKKTRSISSNKDYLRLMLKKTRIKPGYLVRYADDWVLITNSRRNAEKWKWLIAKFLRDELRLTLSEEKTTITDIRKKPIRFLGFEYKVVKGKAQKGYITRTQPDAERLKGKVATIHRNTKRLRRSKSQEELLHRIHILNSQIRGVILYYRSATWVNIALNKYTQRLIYAGYKALKRFGGKWTPANQVNNLIPVHAGFVAQIPAIKVNDLTIGITSFLFCKFEKQYTRDPKETPYSIEGRTIYYNRTEKAPLLARVEELYSDLWSEKLAFCSSPSSFRNLEYYLNRAYAYNRDKGKCRICGEIVLPHALHTHHIDNKLPISLINKVANLASTHENCHQLIHNESSDLTQYSKKIATKVLGFRDKLR
jgi:group II intron reverse transcriptase/maturase